MPPNAEAIGFAVGAIAVQLDGTDNGPSEAALPKPADTPLPRPPSPPRSQASQRAGKPTGGGTERHRSQPLLRHLPPLTQRWVAEQTHEGT